MKYLTLQISDKLHQDLKIQAIKHHLTLAQYCEQKLGGTTK